MIRKLVLTTAFVLCGSAAQATDSFNVSIDGHCNTFALNVDGVLVAGTRGGCEGSAIEGGTVARVAHKRGVVVSESNGSQVVTWLFTTPEAGHGKVYAYGSDGNTSSQLASGDYTIEHNPPANREKRAGRDITTEFSSKR